MTEDYFINADNQKLFRLFYDKNVEKALALVFICHGLHEHSKSSYYFPIIEPLRKLGCYILTHDHIGHGESDGVRCCMVNFDVHVRDVYHDIIDARKVYNISEELPIYLYGHSIGGLICINFVLKFRGFVEGLCLEAPALKFPVTVNRFGLFIGRIASILCPKLTMGKLNYDDMTRNETIVEEIRKDPLQYHKGISTRNGIAIFDKIAETKRKFFEISIPIFVAHGEADAICPVEGSKILMRDIQSVDKTFIIFPGARHQLRREIEPCVTHFKSAVFKWFQNQIDKQKELKE